MASRRENPHFAKNARLKYCFVPGCSSSALNDPEKIFINVPKGHSRLKWLTQVRREPGSLSLQSTMYCCEDHFDLQEDLENYMRVKLDASAKIQLKKGVLPRFFNCQPDRKRAHATQIRAVVQKLRRTEMLKGIQLEQDAFDNQQHSGVAEEPVCPSSSLVDCDLRISDGQDVEGSMLEHLSLCDRSCDPSESTAPLTKDFGIQVSLRPHYRSKYVQCNISNAPEQKDASCSPIQSMPRIQSIPGPTSLLDLTTDTGSTNILDNTLESLDEYLPTDDESEESLKRQKENVKLQTLKLRVARIEARPKNYIGVPEHALVVLREIVSESKVQLENVYLTLEKIKTNQTFTILGDEYGKNCTFANIVFRQTVPLLAHYLKPFIFWPSAETIKHALPLAFRARYNDVQSIIDCFEIQIQKPSNPVHQALTWSEYKKCNTIKYLISATPDGMVNYISEGFSGRTTDMTIVEKSDFVQKLPPNCAVMADRGFKHIEPILIKNNCKLIRPPSVSANEKLSKSAVLETRRIASLRIHIERIIRRIREYEILTPHAEIPFSMLDIVDEIVVIAAALNNLQSPVIAQ